MKSTADERDFATSKHRRIASDPWHSARRNVRGLLRNTLLALRGWAGMIWQTETRPDRVYRYSSVGTLIEFMAVRLLLDRLAAAQVRRRHLISEAN